MGMEGFLNVVVAALAALASGAFAYLLGMAEVRAVFLHPGGKFA
jgi:hypothetical protein